jgi:hypothetical protein
MFVDLAATIALEWMRVAARHRGVDPYHQPERTLALEDEMTVMLREVVVAARAMRKNVAFTAAAVLTLALGLSATTAIFSVVESVLLRPLPFPASERIVVPELQRIGSGERVYITYADFMDWRDNDVFEAVAAYQQTQLDLTGQDEPVRVNAVVAGPQFFAALGMPPEKGRFLAPVDYGIDAPRAAKRQGIPVLAHIRRSAGAAFDQDFLLGSLICHEFGEI